MALEMLNCPQSVLVIGKYCGDSIQRMETFLGKQWADIGLLGTRSGK